MSMDEALRSFTTDASYAAFEENDKGQISPGKWADITILDRDVMKMHPAELLKARVVATIINGVVAYSQMPEM